MGLLDSLLYRKEGGISKMKLGAILGTVGGMLVAVGGMLTGEVDLMAGLQALGPLVGTLLVVVGLRDAVK